MTPNEATDLAKRIINTWHGGPRLDEWTDTLTELDAGTAGTAFIRLRSDEERAPSIARFMREYRGLATPANQPVGRNPLDPPDCPKCDDTGWVTATEIAAGDPTSYSSVAPCHACGEGRHADDVRDKIARDNHWPKRRGAA